MMRVVQRLMAVAALFLLGFTMAVGAQQPPPPGGPGEPGGTGGSARLSVGANVVQATLDTINYTTYGAGIDGMFRNSGVIINEEINAYYAVNGVHPVNQGDYTSYYPKSIVMASLEDDTILRAYPFDGVERPRR